MPPSLSYLSIFNKILMFHILIYIYTYIYFFLDILKHRSLMMYLSFQYVIGINLNIFHGSPSTVLTKQTDCPRSSCAGITHARSSSFDSLRLVRRSGSSRSRSSVSHERVRKRVDDVAAARRARGSTRTPASSVGRTTPRDAS